MKHRRNSFLFASATIRVPAAFFGLIAISHMQASAATKYWDSNGTTAGAGTTPTGTWGTDNFWSTDSTGSAAPGAWAAGDDAVFSASTDATGSYTVTLGGAISALTLNVEEGSPTLSAASAQTLTLAGKGNASSPWDPATLNIASGSTLAIGENIAVSLTGNVDHYLAGTGNLTIGGTNASLSTSSTVGLLVINGPTVTVNAGGSINHTRTDGTLLVGAGGTTSKLVVSGGDVNITGSGGLKLANNTGSSSSVELNSGTITAAKVSKGNGTGTIYFDGGTLKASAASTSYWAASTVDAKVRDGGAVINTNNFDITISQIFSEDATSTGGGLTKSGAGTLTTDVNHTFTGKVTINGGTLSTNRIANAGIASGLGQGSGANAIIDIGGAGTLRYSGGNVSTDRVVNVLTGGGTVRADGSGTLTLAGGITGNGGISLRGTKNITVDGAISIGQANPMVKTDAATVTLSNGANDFGYIGIAAGTVSVNSIANNGTASALGKGPTTNSASIQLGQSSSNTAGILSFTGASGGSSNRTIRLNNATSGTTGGVGTIENTVAGQLLTLSGGVSVQNSGGTASLTLQGEGNGELSGNITQNGTLSLTKAGGGTWILSGTNSYTGTTTVSGGQLVINGNNSSATGAVTVSNLDTRLAGDGTIGGNTTINDKAIHSPGNSPGVQKFTGNLTYADGSIFEWDIDRTKTQTRGTGYDGVNVTGTLTGQDGTDPNSTFDAKFRIVITDADFTNTFWDTNRTWSDIFTAADGTTAKADWKNIFGGGFEYFYNNGTTLTSISAPDAATIGSFSFTGGNTLTWTAVPEPTGAVAGLLLASGLLRRRRRMS